MRRPRQQGAVLTRPSWWGAGPAEAESLGDVPAEEGGGVEEIGGIETTCERRGRCGCRGVIRVRGSRGARQGGQGQCGGSDDGCGLAFDHVFTPWICSLAEMTFHPCGTGDARDLVAREIIHLRQKMPKCLQR